MHTIRQQWSRIICYELHLVIFCIQSIGRLPVFHSESKNIFLPCSKSLLGSMRRNGFKNLKWLLTLCRPCVYLLNFNPGRRKTDRQIACIIMDSHKRFVCNHVTLSLYRVLGLHCWEKASMCKDSITTFVSFALPLLNSKLLFVKVGR